MKGNDPVSGLGRGWVAVGTARVPGSFCRVRETAGSAREQVKRAVPQLRGRCTSIPAGFVGYGSARGLQARAGAQGWQCLGLRASGGAGA